MNALTSLTGDLRVLVVDDSLVIRGLITRHLRDVPGLSVVASASDGAKAVERVSKGDIDMVVLDIEMPNMDGLTALPHLLKIDPKLVVIMASTLTTRNADISLKAMRLGAADYVPKPTSSAEIYSAEDFRRDLIDKISSLGARRRRLTTRRALTTPASPTNQIRAAGTRRPQVLAVASSTGGPKALSGFFKHLPKDIDLPIVLTQHMPPTFTAMLAEHLSRDTGWPTREACTGDRLAPGQVLIAPGDHHLLISQDAGRLVARLGQGEKENFCRPAADTMLRSLVTTANVPVLAVVLTGMGHDGLAGCQAVVKEGGTVLAQDEDSSVVWGMPGAVAQHGLCAALATPERLAEIAGHFIKTGRLLMTTDMEFLAAFLKKTTGIILATDKGYLVESRLTSVAACHGHATVTALVEALKAFPAENLRRDVIEAMTTNETSFFRDGTPFEIMKTHALPQLLASRATSRRLRIWCAAASTGQEPYSLAMMLSEMGPKLAGWKVEILGTDIDTTALRKASEATFTKFEIQRGLPVTHLVKYFEQATPDAWRLKPAVRDMVTFRQLNLLDGKAAAGTFDIIFCRNVLIYFDLATKADILRRLSSQLADDGYLFLGGAETVLGITDALAPCPGVRGTYVKPVQRAVAA